MVGLQEFHLSLCQLCTMVEYTVDRLFLFWALQSGILVQFELTLFDRRPSSLNMYTNIPDA